MKTSPGVNFRAIRFLVFLLMMLTAMTGLASSERTPQAPGSGVLAGFWMRPDGGYILELSEIGEGGILKASYYNPQPINAARAEWREGENGLEVFVELRDVNYPGSTYSLRYDAAADRLRGIYFQALQGQYFDVIFVRTRVETEGGKSP